MWQFGDSDKYGWRMPGTKSDHQASAFLEQMFAEAGLQDVTREAVPIPVHFPDRWALTVQAGDIREELPCCFMRYAAPTPAEGLTARLVFVGRGSAGEFQARAGEVAGNIAVVDFVSNGVEINYGAPPIWTYDRNNTLPGDMYSETYPVDRQQEVTELARRFGAVGLVGILVSRPDDVCVEYHGPKNGNQVISAVTVGPSSGRRIKELMSGGPVDGTLVLAEDPGSPPPGGPTRFGKWGLTHNVYGVLPGLSDEVLLLVSHHDGGAVNEGSGPAVMVAVAKHFAQCKTPRRKTLMFFVIGAHFGLRPPLLVQAKGIAEVRDRVSCAMVVEMIGKQYKVRDGKHVETGLSSPVMWGVTGDNPALIPLVRAAIEKHDLDRSFISDRLLGEGATLVKEGGLTNIIEHIGLNAPQFSLEDRPEGVLKEALRPTACAFVDIIQRLDAS
jgi:hypothetical protein